MVKGGMLTAGGCGVRMGVVGGWERGCLRGEEGYIEIWGREVVPCWYPSVDRPSGVSARCRGFDHHDTSWRHM